jgi:hypothetical protein
LIAVGPALAMSMILPGCISSIPMAKAAPYFP